jgi:hypothetical protein
VGGVVAAPSGAHLHFHSGLIPENKKGRNAAFFDTPIKTD